ncbi:MAG: mandelate racemase/muconate lactonizing enzyme family protein [Blastocatellia bacterium]|nr:mandelate racemase/muconate lactonizing enzyme family protein [Blastocatellia bacterium]
MKITKIETITLTRSITIHAGKISWLWVRIHTDEGLIGLGETYPAAASAEAVIRDSFAPLLLGRDPREIERLWADLFLAVSFHGWAGAEIRALSAIDVALWDLLGKFTGQPVYQLLGGRTRERIRTYNTCYDHVYAFNQDADKLAEDLLRTGVTAMKIWPFDETALRNRGEYITPAELRHCIEPVRKIRDAVGDRMEIAMEFHGYWNLPSAVKIARALEPFNVMWLEEMLPQDNLAAYSRLKQETNIPLILSERLMTRWQFREVVESGIAQIVNPDICWCGGITEAKKIATLAETHYIPVAPHNCGGPVLHFASLHLAANVPNLYILESVRRHYLKEYQGLVTATGPATDGWLSAPDAPGLGVDLDPAVYARPDVTVSSCEE